MGQKMIQKRFVAGVVCPKCGEMDKIRMYRDENDDEQWSDNNKLACIFTSSSKRINNKNDKNS